jgi:hypothetical protein
LISIGTAHRDLIFSCNTEEIVMLVLLAMAGSVFAALVVGIYLSISMGEDAAPVFADEPSEVNSAPGER